MTHLIIDSRDARLYFLVPLIAIWSTIDLEPSSTSSLITEVVRFRIFWVIVKAPGLRKKQSETKLGRINSIGTWIKTTGRLG